MGKIFIILGIVLILFGLGFLGKLGPFSRLPGDLVLEKENFKVYIPLMSMLLLSIIISFIFWLMQR